MRITCLSIGLMMNKYCGALKTANSNVTGIVDQPVADDNIVAMACTLRIREGASDEQNATNYPILGAI